MFSITTVKELSPVRETASGYNSTVGAIKPLESKKDAA